MLEYRINTKDFVKTSDILPVNKVTLINLSELLSDDDYYYDGNNRDKFMVVCETDDIDNLQEGSIVETNNILTLSFYQGNGMIENTYNFKNTYQINNLDQNEKTFNFYIDKQTKLDVTKLVCGYQFYNPSYFFENHELDEIFLYCESYHYFDITDNLNEDGQQQIPIYFKYANNEGEIVTTTINFRYYDYSTLATSLKEFEGNEDFFKMLFGVELSFVNEEDGLTYYIVLPNQKPTTATTYGWKSISIEHNGYMYYTWVEMESEYDLDAMQNPQAVHGSLNGIDIYRDTFLFGEKTFYEFKIDKIFANIDVPFTNSFGDDLFHIDLLNEYFVKKEKRNVINDIVDIEKDVYYPCIKVCDELQEVCELQDVYSIKFNLHFREHRTKDWTISNESLWNGVKQDHYYVNINNGQDKITEEVYNAKTDNQKVFYRETDEIIPNSARIINEITNDDVSDLLTFLNFTNDDVHYQKNKLKKSFLRLSFYDSENPADQNLIAYSTIFFNTGNLFAKYSKYIEADGYIDVSFGINDFGKYILTYNKKGVRVDREYSENGVFIENKRLSSQLEVQDKNMSASSSEGFYLYIWKDNESCSPQELFMKVEFNHAGYGRTIPFMMPYWDKQKSERNGVQVRSKKIGIKTFQEIIDDWNSVKIYRNTEHPNIIKTISEYSRLSNTEQSNYYPDWKNGNIDTDGHYGIRQYNKYSYIHLKYQYDKDKDKHYYYIDTDTYGQQENNNNEIVINLYEAKIE